MSYNVLYQQCLGVLNKRCANRRPTGKKQIILILQIASGSDDLSVIIWDWEKEKNLLAFNTGHKANVFQVGRLSTMFILIFILIFIRVFFILISIFYTAIFLY